MSQNEIIERVERALWRTSRHGEDEWTEMAERAIEAHKAALAEAGFVIVRCQQINAVTRGAEIDAQIIDIPGQAAISGTNLACKHGTVGYCPVCAGVCGCAHCLQDRHKNDPRTCRE